MTGFLDVLVRGALLVAGSLVLGGVLWTRLVLRAEAGAKPDGATSLALRLIAAGAGAAALLQATVMAVGLTALAGAHGAWPVGAYLQTTFAQVSLGRVVVAVAVAGLAARMAGRPAGPAAWRALGVGAAALVASSALLSHAMARLDARAPLVLLDAAHQLAAAAWVGGLAHLVVHAAWRRRHAPDLGDGAGIVRRFSTLAFGAMSALVVAGVALSVPYVGEPAALVGTAYGIMILTKVVLLAAALALAASNFRLVRRAAASFGSVGLLRFAEVELGLGLTVLFAAASLTSLPPAVDVRDDRATVAEVAARFAPAAPRLVSPPVAELIRTAEPLMAPAGVRTDIERAWSEYNHHWAGFFVTVMALLACLERAGVRAARHWPLAFLGLGAFMFLRNDPRAWPLGPAGFWESLWLPDVLQHRLYVVVVVAFGVFEWAVRTGRLPRRPWAFVFPVLCAAGGGLLLTHSHAMFDLKAEFLVEITHAPIAILGAFVGWGRWLELRLPAAERAGGWLWRGCLLTVGLLLVFYREG
jgi:putative copper resistance protein D